MKKIVIIGANDFQNQLILKAKEMGFETHVFAWQDGSIGERTADHFYPVSIVEINEILEKRKAHADAEIQDATKAKEEAQAMKAEYEENMQNAETGSG